MLAHLQQQLVPEQKEGKEAAAAAVNDAVNEEVEDITSSMTTISPYQGGMPLLYSRVGAGQRGAGFFSSLRKFLVPIGKALLPSAIGAAGDLIGGKSLGEIVKSRGPGAGRRVLGAAATTLAKQFAGGDDIGGGDEEAAATPSPPKKYKKAHAPPKKSVVKRKKKSSGFW